MAGISFCSIVRAIGISRAARCGEWGNRGFVLRGMSAGVPGPKILKQLELSALPYVIKAGFFTGVFCQLKA